MQTTDLPKIETPCHDRRRKSFVYRCERCKIDSVYCPPGNICPNCGDEVARKDSVQSDPRGLEISRVYKKAKTQGRLCERCGWIITVPNWKKGYKICGSCFDALRGVNVGYGAYKASDEKADRTGEMP